MITAKPYQLEALQSLAAARRKGSNRALVVMASGLGKTVTAALDVKRFFYQHPTAKVLFLCHQNDILEQARIEFAKVFTLTRHTMGLYYGQERERADEFQFLFASFQMMRDWRTNFKATHFDYIIVDESHHSPAPTYEPTIEYFKPSFLLALTATPERTDLDDIRRLYGQEVYHLPLEDALVRGLLTRIDYRLLTDEISFQKMIHTPVGKLSVKEINNKFFIKKRDNEIVNIILDKIKSINQPKVMMFCRTTAHCDRLAKLMPGAVAIHHNMPRTEQKLRLQQFREQQRGIVLTVDMFNEGIDVPEANVIVFLRSTAAPIVFYQQLGRGLREHHGKKKVLVLDFVGNCERLAMLDSLFQFILRRRKEIGDYEKLEPFNVNVGHVEFTETAQRVVDILKKIREGYTKEALIAQLVQLAERLGRTPSQNDVEEASSNRECASVGTFRAFFGSFSEALRAAQMKAYPKHSKETMVKQLQSLAGELGHTPTSKEIESASRKRKCPTCQTLINHFGSIIVALQQAGLEVATERSSHLLNKQDIILQLQALASELGRTPTLEDIREFQKKGRCVSVQTIYARFGSFLAALKAAKLDLNKRQKATL